MKLIRDEFGERPLIAGEIYGIRSWRLGPDGILRSPYTGAQWFRPEHTAQCLSPVGSIVDDDPWTPYGNCSRTNPLSSLPCRCGIYAYYLDPSEILLGGVVGIIKGYGETEVGTRGFRCQKAKIVALAPVYSGFYRFTSKGLPNHWHYSGFSRRLLKKNYPDVPVYRSVDKMLKNHEVTTLQSVEGLMMGV